MYRTNCEKPDQTVVSASLSGFLLSHTWDYLSFPHSMLYNYHLKHMLLNLLLQATTNAKHINPSTLEFLKCSSISEFGHIHCYKQGFSKKSITEWQTV